MNAAEKARYLLAANARNLPIEGGLFLSTALQQVGLDYTEGSLKRIDALLDQVRERLKPALPGFLDDPQKENFALTLGFYLGEYVARVSSKPVEWLDYDEAVRRLPAEQTPPRSFLTHVTGFVERVLLMPLVVLKERLFSGAGETTAQKFVDDALSTIESQVKTRGDEWKPEYLDLFLAGKKVPGSVAFADVLKDAGLDFSRASLARIDALLAAVRSRVQPQYGQFISLLPNANFVWLLATYLGRTAAQLKNCSLKWIDFETARGLNPSLLNKFETTHNCLLGDRMSHPMMVINERLFGDLGRGGCERYAAAIVESDLPVLISLFRDTVPPDTKGERLFARFRSGPKMVWQPPVRQAGFLAAHGAFLGEGGLPVSPMLLQPKPGGEHQLVDFSLYQDWNAAHQRGQDELQHNPAKLPYQAFMYEGYANLPHARLDAIVVELRCYTKPTLELTIAVPFHPAKSATGFRLYRPKMVYCSESPSLAPEFAIAFYEGVDSNKAFSWNKYLDETR